MKNLPKSFTKIESSYLLKHLDEITFSKKEYNIRYDKEVVISNKELILFGMIDVNRFKKIEL